MTTTKPAAKSSNKVLMALKRVLSGRAATRPQRDPSVLTFARLGLLGTRTW